MNREDSADGARRCHGAETDVELLRGGAEIGEDRIEVEIRLGLALFRGLHEKVVEDRRLTACLGQEEAAAAE